MTQIGAQRIKHQGETRCQRIYDDLGKAQIPTNDPTLAVHRWGPLQSIHDDRANMLTVSRRLSPSAVSMIGGDHPAPDGARIFRAGAAGGIGITKTGEF